MIVSDGGCIMSGDVVKVFGGGVDFVMLGGMLVGYEESGGSVVEENGEKFMLFYGMSLEFVMNCYVGGVVKYCVVEGKMVKLLLCGLVGNIVCDILGGLCLVCIYVGVFCLKELIKCIIFIWVQE